MAQERVVLKHRAIFDVHPLNEDGDAFRAVAQAVVDWLVEKENRFGSSPIADDLAGRRAFPKAWDYCNPREYRGGDYDADEWPALACASTTRMASCTAGSWSTTSLTPAMTTVAGTPPSA